MKKLAILALCLVMVLSMAACGGTTSAPSSAAAPAAPAASSEAPAAPAASEAPAGPQALTMLTWDRTVSSYWDDSVNAFIADNPDYTVEIADIPAADYIDKVTIMLAAQDKTDVLPVKSMDQYSLVTSKGQLENLMPYIQRDNFDMAPYGGADKGITLDDGGIYGLPYRSDKDVLFYNKKIFDDAGVAYPSATVPMSLDEFKALAKQLTKGEGDGKIYGGLIHTWSSCISDFAVALGKDNLTDVGSDYMWLAPAYNAILEMQNVDKSIPDFGYLKTGNIGYRPQFFGNTIAMLPMGTWLITDLIKGNASGEIDVSWGMAPAPVLGGGTKVMTAGGVTPMSVNGYSENKDAAWELVKYLCGEKGAMALASTGTLPGYSTTAVLDKISSLDGFPVDSKDALKVDSLVLQIPPKSFAGQIKQIQDEEDALIRIGDLTVEAGLKEFADRVAAEVS